jgi:hypothetical protein
VICVPARALPTQNEPKEKSDSIFSFVHSINNDSSFKNQQPVNSKVQRETRNHHNHSENSNPKGNVQQQNEAVPLFLCDNGCGRYIAANRYAPHLEMCMGLKQRNRRYF